jgi:hypothetical protein
MHTHTPPHDYNRRPYYDSVAELNEFRRFEQNRDALIAIIGKRQYDQFLTGFHPAIRANYTEPAEAIGQELGYYECSCNPIDDACPGCAARYQARRDQEAEQDAWLEMAYEDQYTEAE